MNFSFKLIIILHMSHSDLSLVRAEIPDFILNARMNGKVKHCHYLRIFALFVLTDADERWIAMTQAKIVHSPVFIVRLPKATGCNK